MTLTNQVLTAHKREHDRQQYRQQHWMEDVTPRQLHELWQNSLEVATFIKSWGVTSEQQMFIGFKNGKLLSGVTVDGTSLFRYLEETTVTTVKVAISAQNGTGQPIIEIHTIKQVSDLQPLLGKTLTAGNLNGWILPQERPEVVQLHQQVERLNHPFYLPLIFIVMIGVLPIASAELFYSLSCRVFGTVSNQFWPSFTGLLLGCGLVMWVGRRIDIHVNTVLLKEAQELRHDLKPLDS